MSIFLIFIEREIGKPMINQRERDGSGMAKGTKREESAFFFFSSIDANQSE
jgi:hypothetical protein